MNTPAPMSHPMPSAPALSSTRLRLLLAAGLVLVTGALIATHPVMRLGLLASGATVLAVAILSALMGRRGARGAGRAFERLAGRDPAPGFATDPEGHLLWRNAAARARFGNRPQATLVRALGELFANPAAVIYRLQARARADGAAREDVVTRRGHVRITVHEAMPDTFFWRFDEMEERGGGKGAEALTLPFLTVGRNDTILFMNEAARRLAGGRMKSLDTMLPVRPTQPGALCTLHGGDGPITVRVAEYETGSGRREIYIVPVEASPETIAPPPVLDSLPVALLKLRPDGQVLTANAAARKLLDRPEGPMDLADLVEGLGRPVRDWLVEVAEGRAAKTSEVLQLRGSGREGAENFLKLALAPVSEEGEPALVAILQDATELKTLEAQFVQSQKMQAIGQLAGGVAHDFNNLLTAISGHCDLLLLRHDEGDPEYGDLMQIHQNANRAASLVGQLLAYSRKQTLRPEPVDLAETMAEMSHLLNRLVGERVNLRVVGDNRLPPIRADRRQLEQVIMNLVVNARDAMPEGGDIRVETVIEEVAQPFSRDRVTVPAGRYVVMRVRDQGHGIPADKLDKIFDPFFTTKKPGEGTGLGLSTAYGIVKQSGGFIFADSDPGAGACFTLYFPALPAHAHPLAEALSQGRPNDRAASPVHEEAARAAVDESAAVVSRVLGDAQARAARPEPAAPAQSPGAGVVLLVEDEAPVRAFAARALRMRGFTVLEADSAEAALETLEDEQVSVDVFVTDVVMPGLDGPSWVRRALRDRPDTRVVFVSGYAEESLSETRARVPNSVFLPKPFSLTELTDTVRQQVSPA